MLEKEFKTRTTGKGNLVIAVTAYLHGNEPVGKHVHDWLLTQDLDAKVKLIFGNPEAYQADKRFIDMNLNRVFPGDQGGCYEERQAFRIMQEMEDVDIHIDFHSTTPDTDPFAICILGKKDDELIKATGLENVMIYSGQYPGKSMNQVMECPSIAVECGQHNASSTSANGMGVMKNVLQHYGALPGTPSYVQQEHFLLTGTLKGSDDVKIEKAVKEFQSVKQGQVVAAGTYARITAQKGFFPILVDRDPKLREDGVLMVTSEKVNYANGKVMGRER